MVAILSPSSRHSRAESARGSVIAELVIVFPLLLLLFIGILEAGRTASTVARAAQTAYNAALLGGKTSRTIRFAAMDQRGQELQDFLVRDLVNINTVPSENLNQRTVSYEFQADLMAIFPNLGWGIGLSFTAPDLILASGTAIDYNVFGNGACYYDCDLDITATCPVSGGQTCSPPPTDPLREEAGEFTIGGEYEVQTFHLKKGLTLELVDELG